MEGGQSQGHDAAFTWFTELQLQSVIRNGIVPEWFHGIISRKTAEELLLPKPPGYFLIRVSESRIGYTLSYRAEDRCRHFMIDALKDGHYIIVGETTHHRFLQDLVDFHRRTPIMPFHEVLTVPCGQISQDNTDYAELLFPKRHLPNPDPSPLQHNSLHPNNKTHLKPQEVVPPALPHRPTTLTNSAVLSPNVAMTPAVPNSKPNTLYPSLEHELSHFISQIPAMPVPMPRKRYTAQADQPPEVPARTAAPPQKQNQACTRTISAPRPTERHAAAQWTGQQEEDQPRNTDRTQDVKPSVVTNLMNLRRKFQKRRSMSHTYAEISAEAEGRQEGRLGGPEAGDGNGNDENEYQEISGEQIINQPPFSNAGPAKRLTDSGLPQEYQPPPPFAPGY
ncbi:hematopoietic SH2 domain-containing protein homolog [Centroberyx gerrardi]|uniref:hematopoietic SH2 domain-containing protein homolog n=1 Tax=Centroberyx gerrardi TaxID=166262 RepID=UPI003AADDC6C